MSSVDGKGRRVFLLDLCAKQTRVVSHVRLLFAFQVNRLEPPLPPCQSPDFSNRRKALKNQRIFSLAVCNNRRMCGRYRVSKRKQILAEHFNALPEDEDWSPHYNVAPTQAVPVIRQHPNEPARHLLLLRWGLIPPWMKDSSRAARMINARSETAHTQPAFRDSFRSRRCLIPADGFYEWQKKGATKQPFCFEVNAGELFAFAGLWERWKNPNGEWIKTCTILTTETNSVTAPIHDRMPVILNLDDYDLWLDPGMTDLATASDLLKPFDAKLMRRYPVSNRVNNVANDDEECSRVIELSESQTTLFNCE
jgi:putative SOS response-associated peptidase YedK